MKRQSKTIFEFQAETCKTIARPRRLDILSAFKNGEKLVTDLVDIVDIPKANISQHPAFIRHTGIVKMRKEDIYNYFSITSPKILKACCIMREVLTERIRRNEKIFQGRKNF